MGVKNLRSSVTVVDSCGYFLFGAENYSPTDTFAGQAPAQVGSELNLFKLSDILGAEFPSFPGYLSRLSELYEDVMQYADDIAESRSLHSSLDDIVLGRVRTHLVSSEGRSGLYDAIRDAGNGILKSHWMMMSGNVPVSIVDKYIREKGSNSVGYDEAASTAHNLLVEQANKLGPVDPNMAEFSKLLYSELRKMALSVKAQKILVEELGPHAAKDTANYFERSIVLLPNYCYRLVGLKKAVASYKSSGTYVMDNLKELTSHSLLSS